MPQVFILWHVGPEFEEKGDEADSKLLGVFSTEAKAIAWQEEAKSLPGFSDAQDRFLLDRYTVDEPQWTEGFVTR